MLIKSRDNKKLNDSTTHLENCQLSVNNQNYNQLSFCSPKGRGEGWLRRADLTEYLYMGVDICIYRMVLN